MFAAYQSFHFPQLWTSTNLSLHHSCLRKLRAVWFYRNNHLHVANPFLWGKSVFIASGVWFWDPDFGWISLATHHHLQVCALLVVGFVDEAWHVSWLVRFPRRTFIIELSFKPAHTMHCGNSWNTCLRPIRLGFLREQLFNWELHGKIAILHLEKYLSFNAETWNIGWFIHDFIPFHPFQHHFDSSQKRSAID